MRIRRIQERAEMYQRSFRLAQISCPTTTTSQTMMYTVAAVPCRRKMMLPGIPTIATTSEVAKIARGSRRF